MQRRIFSFTILLSYLSALLAYPVWASDADKVSLNSNDHSLLCARVLGKSFSASKEKTQRFAELSLKGIERLAREYPNELLKAIQDFRAINQRSTSLEKEKRFITVAFPHFSAAIWIASTSSAHLELQVLSFERHTQGGLSASFYEFVGLLARLSAEALVQNESLSKITILSKVESPEVREILKGNIPGLAPHSMTIIESAIVSAITTLSYGVLIAFVTGELIPLFDPAAVSTGIATGVATFATSRYINREMLSVVWMPPDRRARD